MAKENEVQHELLGLFVAEKLKRAHLNILEMCTEIDMGPNTYEGLKKGIDKHLKHYTRILDYYFDNLTEEEFLQEATGWVKLYIRYRKKLEDKQRGMNPKE